MTDFSLLTPKEGVEKITIKGGIDGIAYDIPGTEVTAHSGSGIDFDSPQHRIGSDAVRYAIAIQQQRDAGNYDASDKIRDIVMKQKIYSVGTSKEATTVLLIA